MSIDLRLVRLAKRLPPPTKQRPDLSMLSEEELLELEHIGRLAQPSAYDPIDLDSLADAPRRRLDELAHKASTGAMP